MVGAMTRRIFLLAPGRSAAGVLRAGVHSTLHGVVFAILAPKHAAHHTTHQAADKGSTTGVRTTLRGRGSSGIAGAGTCRTGRLFYRRLAGGGWGARDDFRPQSLVLQLVEEAALGITAC